MEMVKKYSKELIKDFKALGYGFKIKEKKDAALNEFGLYLMVTVNGKLYVKITLNNKQRLKKEKIDLTGFLEHYIADFGSEKEKKIFIEYNKSKMSLDMLLYDFDNAVNIQVYDEEKERLIKKIIETLIKAKKLKSNVSIIDKYNIYFNNNYYHIIRYIPHSDYFDRAFKIVVTKNEIKREVLDDLLRFREKVVNRYKISSCERL